MTLCRLERLTEAARELSKATGQTCIPAQADVRQPQQLKDAVAKTIEHFGRIDFVICGRSTTLRVTQGMTLTMVGSS